MVLTAHNFRKRYVHLIVGSLIATGGTAYFFWNNHVPATIGSITILLVAVCILLPLWLYQESYASSPGLMLLGFIEIAWILVINFSVEYWSLSHESPSSFKLACAILTSKCTLTHIDAVYLTLTIFTTTGFGDITPLSQFARAVVSIQMCVAILFFVAGLSYVVNRLGKHRI
jgi:voltage-gated potassium channel